MGVNVNCVSCTRAAFSRFIGRDPEAKAENSEDYGDMKDLLHDFIYGNRDNMTPEGIRQELLDGGDGTVAAVIIETDIVENVEFSHVIFAYNKGGTVTFIDTQLGKIVELKQGLNLKMGIMYEWDYKTEKKDE